MDLLNVYFFVFQGHVRGIEGALPGGGPSQMPLLLSRHCTGNFQQFDENDESYRQKRTIRKDKMVCLLELTQIPVGVKAKPGDEGEPGEGYMTQETSSRIRVFELRNTIEYYLNAVWIEHKAGSFRLVVVQHNRVLTDRCYGSLKGAKQAFARKYNRKAWKKDVSARCLENFIRRSNESFERGSQHIEKNRQEVKGV